MPAVTGRQAWLGGPGGSATARGGRQTSGPGCRQPGGAGGGRASGVKSREGACAPRGHGGRLPRLGAEPRTYGARSALASLVVRTVNDGCRRPAASQTQSTPPGKQPQGRGPKEIGGSLLQRWGMWFNSTVPGPPYLLPWGPALALTRGCGRAPRWCCMAVVSSCCEAWPWVAQRTQPPGARRGRPGHPAGGPSRPAPGGGSQVNMA